MRVLRVCLTIDVDFVGYTLEGAHMDEFEFGVPCILEVLRSGTNWPVTWFLRIDGQMEAVYGEADYIFRRYAREIRRLRALGHEIGWHPHSYVRDEGRWRQNVDEHGIVEELRCYAPVARSHGLRCVRMGWGFHTNRTLALLSRLGFTVDSSAIPRPNYIWEVTHKDWRTTPSSPYFPSVSDYRVPGTPSLSILEIPISVEPVPAPYDTVGVVRYLNPAFHPELLREPLQSWIARQSHLVLITHPYEVAAVHPPHGLIAFDPEVFRANLEALPEIAEGQGARVSAHTLTEFADLYRREL